MTKAKWHVSGHSKSIVKMKPCQLLRNWSLLTIRSSRSCTMLLSMLPNTWKTLHVRDCQGRTLHQAIFASGYKTFIEDPMFFLGMSDEQVREIDPRSDLYPFMVAASGETCDLSAVYALLRRNPVLAHRNKPKKRRKRKRKWSSFCYNFFLSFKVCIAHASLFQTKFAPITN